MDVPYNRLTLTRARNKMQQTNVYQELGIVDNKSIEVEYEVDFWMLPEVEVEEIRVTGMLINGVRFDFNMSDKFITCMLSLIDVTDSDFILKITDSYYCGLDY